MKSEGAVIGVIPARMGSSRFPGKPLRPIGGIPMVGHVFMRARMSRRLDALYVATCDGEIADYVRGAGGVPIMTSPDHTRASDRTAEALRIVEAENGVKARIVVMIQGDEPMLRPEMIDEAVDGLLADETVFVANLMAPLKTPQEHDDVNEVKVVVDRRGFALYFSREAIPSRRKGGDAVTMMKQVCIIPFRRDFLLKFGELEPTPLEIAESVDMLRVLEHGYKVKMVPTAFDVYSVDTEQDLKKVEKLMATDDLVKLYSPRS